VWTDGSEVLFARSDLVRGAGLDLGEPTTVDSMIQQVSSRYSNSELRTSAKLQLATLELAVGQFAMAGRVLEPLTSPSARALAARSRFLAGDLEAAEALATRLLRERPDDVHGLALMGQLALRRGELQRADQMVRRAIAIDPFDAEATSLLTALEEQIH
jgi:predicted Zn-dependent protease